MKISKRQLFFAIFYSVVTGLITAGIYFDGNRDLDFLWHSELGKDILTNGIPETMNFSWISNDLPIPIYPHEWLTSVLFYLMSAAATSFGLSVEIAGGIFVFITSTGLFFLVKLFLLKDSEHPWLVLLSLAIGYYMSNVRPHNIGAILCFVTLLILVRGFEGKYTKAVYFLPLIALAWANFYGGTLIIMLCFETFFVAFAIMGRIKRVRNIKLFSGTFPEDMDTKPFLKRSLIALVGSILAGMINPQGIKLYLFPFVYNDSVTKMYVSEWHSGTILSMATILFVFCLVAYSIAKGKNISFVRLLPVIGCFLLTGIYSRIQFYTLLTAFFLIEDITESFPEKSLEKKYVVFDSALLGTLCVVFFVICINTKGSYGVTYEFPKELAEILEEKDYSRMYNEYDDGARLVAIGKKSFINAMADSFPGEILSDANDLIFSGAFHSDLESFQEYLDIWNFDAILLEKGRTRKPLIYYLTQSDDWDIVYEDDAGDEENEDSSATEYILFEKNNYVEGNTVYEHYIDQIRGY